MIAEPEAHGGRDPETASPRRVLLREGAEHAEDREAREEREHDVVGDHRRPREVERREHQQEGRDDAPDPSPEHLPEGVEEADPERRVDEAREHDPDLGHAEDATGERRRKPPAEAVGAVVTQHPVVPDDRVDLSAEDDVVTEAVAAEVEHAEAAGDAHEAEEPGEVGGLETSGRVPRRNTLTTRLDRTRRHGHARCFRL